MTDDPFSNDQLDMRYEPLLKSHLTRCFEVFAKDKSLAFTTASRIVAGDPKFFGRLKTGGLKVRTYDDVMARFSALWPGSLPWPDGVPRPAPAVEPAVEEEVRLGDAARIQEIIAGDPVKVAEQWPADIPRPAFLPDANQERG